MELSTTKTVAICDVEPIVVEGVRSLLASQSYLMLVGSETSLASGLDMVSHVRPSILLADKAFGLQALLEWIPRSNAVSEDTAVVVWGTSLHSSEAVRLMQAGARGVMRKMIDLNSMLDCMMTVCAGKTWLEHSLLRDSERIAWRGASNLTLREQEVLDLVEQGMKNKDIALQLGIQPGTVKIHLKHIFEKTGIHGRYGLALRGLKERGVIAIPA